VVKGKGRMHPTTGHECPEGELRYSSTLFLTLALDGDTWGKGGRCVWLTTYHPCSAKTSRKSGALTHPEPLGPPRPVAGDLYFTLLDGGWWSKPRPGRFTPRKETRYTSYRKLGGPRAGLDRRRKSCPHRDSIPRSSSP